METRLDLLSLELAEELSHANVAKQQLIAWSACKMALSHTQLRNSLIDQFLDVTEGKKSVDLPVLRNELLKYAEKLDEVQWNLREEVDNGIETMPNYLQAFTDARVINALYFALDPNPYIAAAESIYEIYAATGNLLSLRNIVSTIMG